MPMTCREGHNSVITSVAWFLTRDPLNKRSDEALVKKTFHDLKRRFTVAGSGEKANPEEVVAFLEGRKSIVRYDPRIKDRLRPDWQQKLDKAIADTEAGRGPDIATFAAWQQLEDSVRATKEGEMEHEVYSPASDTQLAVVAGRAKRLRTQFETVMLERGYRPVPTDPGNRVARLKSQVEAAETEMANLGGDVEAQRIAVLNEARVGTLQSLRSCDEEAERDVLHRRARQAHIQYVRALASHPEMRHLTQAAERAHDDAKVWSSISDTAVASRSDQWHVVEYLAQKRDKDLQDAGVITSMEVQRRRNARKELRTRVRPS